MSRAPRLWDAAVRAWRDPKIRLTLEGVLVLIDPLPEEVEDHGARPWCPFCVELALIEGGAWSNPSAIPTPSGHPERVSEVCNECEFRACETCMEDHTIETKHWSHDLALEGAGA